MTGECMPPKCDAAARDTAGACCAPFPPANGSPLLALPAAVSCAEAMACLAEPFAFPGSSFSPASHIVAACQSAWRCHICAPATPSHTCADATPAPAMRPGCGSACAACTLGAVCEHVTSMPSGSRMKGMIAGCMRRVKRSCQPRILTCDAALGGTTCVDNTAVPMCAGIDRRAAMIARRLSLLCTASVCSGAQSNSGHKGRDTMPLPGCASMERGTSLVWLLRGDCSALLAKRRRLRLCRVLCARRPEPTCC